MATSEEKQDLIDDIKRPFRHYRIRLTGYGIEGVWGESSEEEYQFWGDTEARCEQMELDPDENENPFEVYMFEKEDKEDAYNFVPENLRREGEWYEQDEYDHLSGSDYAATYLEIVEVESDEYTAPEIETILERAELSEFCDEHEIENLWGEVDIDSNHYFQAISSEKGLFFDGLLTTQGKINPALLKFHVTECPNGDDIVNGISYGEGDDPSKWEEIDNDGGDTNGKGLWVELISNK